MRDMSDMRHRIRERLAALKKSARSVGLAVSNNPNLVADYLREKTSSFTTERLRAIAQELHTTQSWLLTGVDPTPGMIPIQGDVSAGEAHFDEAGQIDYLPLPDTEGRIALVVNGDSMAPLARSGDVAVFGPRRDDPSTLINRRVMARLMDGRHVFKVLRPSQTKGRYTLYSVNNAYDPIEDAELQWVCPLEWLRLK